MQWGAIVLLEDEQLVICQEDMSCAFYLFKMPPCWLPFFCVGIKIRFSDVKGNAKAREFARRHWKGHDVDGWGYLSIRVLPMGWISAVGLMQLMHRRILSAPPPDGAGLPTGAEITKSSPLPTSHDQRLREAWQVYLDNYASVHVEPRYRKRVEGEANAWHTAARNAWERWNIPASREKSLSLSLVAKELGCYTDGEVGTLGTTVERRLHTIAFSFFLIGSRNPHRIWLAMCGGHWNFCMQFRRATASTFSSLWTAIAHWQDCGSLPLAVVRELLRACCLAPLMVTDLRAHPDLLITASDASESGGGLAAVAGLTTHGVTAVKSLPQALPPPVRAGFVLLSLFGGIECARRSLDLLGVAPVRHICVECEKSAVRTAGAIYPGVIQHRDVRDFSRSVLHASLAGIHVYFVLISSGSPCQGLSGANALAQGFNDPRTRLFFEALRILKDLHAEKHRVFFMNENVASMSGSDRDTFTHYLGVQPICADAADLCRVRRRRYYWCNWDVGEADGVSSEQREGYKQVNFAAELAGDDSWVSPGWVFEGEDQVNKSNIYEIPTKA